MSRSPTVILTLHEVKGKNLKPLRAGSVKGKNLIPPPSPSREGSLPPGEGGFLSPSTRDCFVPRQVGVLAMTGELSLSLRAEALLSLCPQLRKEDNLSYRLLVSNHIITTRNQQSNHQRQGQLALVMVQDLALCLFCGFSGLNPASCILLYVDMHIKEVRKG